MAAKNDQNSFGYDPLAWMNDEQNEGEDKLADKPEIQSNDTEENAIDSQTHTDISEPTSAKAQDDSSQTDDALAKDKISIALDSILNIQDVNKLYEQLEKSLSYHHIEIDASKVTSIDTANLQLLVIFKQEAGKRHLQVEFDFPSEKFIEAAELLDLAEMLEINSPAAGLF